MMDDPRFKNLNEENVKYINDECASFFKKQCMIPYFDGDNLYLFHDKSEDELWDIQEQLSQLNLKHLQNANCPIGEYRFTNYQYSGLRVLNNMNDVWLKRLTDQLDDLKKVS